MPQPIKYNTGTTTNGCCIRRGNFEVGVKTGYPYGPTNETGFWAGYDVPEGGFVSYQRKDVQGPSIYQMPNVESIVAYGQHLNLSGDVSTPTLVMQACANTNDIMFTNIEYPELPLMDNCILLMDAGYTASYPWGGSNWYDISGTLQTTGGTVTATTAFLSGTTGSSYANSYLLYEGNTGTNVPAFNMGTLNTFTVNIIINTPGILANQNINLIGQRYSQDSGYTPENDCNFLIRGTASGDTVEGVIRVGGTDYTTAGVDISSFNNTWVALTLTYDGSDLKLYVNGTEQSSSPIGVTAISNSLDTLIAGSVNGLPGNSSDYFNGQVNVVNIYNTALDATQVQSLYDTYSPRFVTPTPPVTYNFDVENVDWSVKSVTDQASFELYIKNNSTYTSVQANDFVYSPTRIQCNIIATGGNSLDLISLQITNVNIIGGGFDGLVDLNLGQNSIVTFNPTQSLPSTLTSLRFDSNQIVSFNPTISLPTSLTILTLSNNDMTNQGYTDSEPWATNQSSFDNPCTINFNGNPDGITSTNLESILLGKNTIIVP